MKTLAKKLQNLVQTYLECHHVAFLFHYPVLKPIRVMRATVVENQNNAYEADYANKKSSYAWRFLDG